VREEIVTTRKRRAEIEKELAMTVGQHVSEGFCKFPLLLLVSVNRRYNAIGHQCFQASKRFPSIKHSWVAEEIEKKSFVIALKTHYLM
jgi:hypothetical protein